MCDRDIRYVCSFREHREPEIARHLAVLFANSICRTAHAQRQWRHTESFVLIVGIGASQSEKLIVGQTQRGNELRIKAISQFLSRENIVSGGDRRVRRENALLAYLRNGIDKMCVLICIEKFPGQFERQKRGVPFVKMIDRRLDRQFAQKADAADAEDLFLYDAGFRASTVKMPGDQTINFRVLLDVSVKQVKRDPTDFCKPCLCIHLAAANMHHH